MSTANEVMTQSLATCTPDDTVAHVAEIMRDRDIGDVLVMEDGKLSGIITDRDLVIDALTDGIDPQRTPISRFMCSKVITGNPDWSMTRIARTMAKHQIRRLPIVQDGELLGIISLADIARQERRNSLLAKSLRAVSRPPEAEKSDGAVKNGAIIGLSLLALASSAIAVLSWNRSGREISKQVADSRIYHTAQQAVHVARGRVDEAASSKAARDLRQRVQNNVRDISSQLPRIEVKPPKKRTALFR
jgi:CBS domain-containing protein/transcription elongation GreA/GreB family factor